MYKTAFAEAPATTVFRVGRAKMMLNLAMQRGAPVICILALLILAGIILALTVDIRWGILALMIVFIVTPMVMAFLYFYYGLRPESFVNVMPHKVFFLPGEAVVTLLIPEDEPEQEKEQEKGEPAYRTVEYRFTLQRESPFTLSTDTLTLHTTNGAIPVPLSAFPTPETLTAAMTLAKAEQFDYETDKR